MPDPDPEVLAALLGGVGPYIVITNITDDGVDEVQWIDSGANHLTVIDSSLSHGAIVRSHGAGDERDFSLAIVEREEGRITAEVEAANGPYVGDVFGLRLWETSVWLGLNEACETRVLALEDLTEVTAVPCDSEATNGPAFLREGENTERMFAYTTVKSWLTIYESSADGIRRVIGSSLGARGGTSEIGVGKNVVATTDETQPDELQVTTLDEFRVETSTVSLGMSPMQIVVSPGDKKILAVGTQIELIDVDSRTSGGAWSLPPTPFQLWGGFGPPRRCAVEDDGSWECLLLVWSTEGSGKLRIVQWTNDGDDVKTHELGDFEPPRSLSSPLLSLGVHFQ